MPALAARTILTPEPLDGPGWVEIDRGLVTGVHTGPAPSDALDLGDVTLTPGFVDIHGHGGGGAAYTDGPDAARVALAAHLPHGTTSLVASLVTDTLDRLEAQIRALAPLVTAGELAGIHLEGPWLSDLHRGAHDPQLLADPRLPDVQRLIAAGDGTVVMVTLATERPGGLEAVRWLSASGVIAALGHSDATWQEGHDAVRAGSIVATHLFNAGRPIHQREPGWITAALEEPGMTVELIADGVHVHPALLADVSRIKPGHFVLVTDSMAAAAASDGNYDLGPLKVEVRDGVARLAGSDTIAGSTLTLDKAVRTCVGAGIGLVDAVRAATRIPADLLGRSDLGRLEPGCRADLVALDADLRVTDVWRRGTRVA